MGKIYAAMMIMEYYRQSKAKKLQAMREEQVCENCKCKNKYATVPKSENVAEWFFYAFYLQQIMCTLK